MGEVLEKKAEALGEENLDIRQSLAQLKAEVKETAEAPELEKDNYKIDAGLSKKEKKANGWKEEKTMAWVGREQIQIKVLKKELAPGAFVWEYQADDKMPEYLVGEQLFNRAAVKTLGLDQKLPTYAQMLALRGEDHQNFLEKNFTKGDKNMFTGIWSSSEETFNAIGRRAEFWLSNGDTADVDENKLSMRPTVPEYGFSVRLLKQE